MRIFVSYPAEIRPLAERVAATLLAERHDVFFDGHDIATGDAFDQRIRSEIERTDVVVFLITPASVKPGGYPRAELSIAERRWPTLHGHVLPFMVAETPLDTIPESLRQLSITRPAGEPVAEIAAVVSEFAKRRRGPASTLVRGVLVASVIGITGAAVWAWQTRGSRAAAAEPVRGLPALAAFAPSTIDSSLRERARAVVRLGNSFYLAVTGPNVLIRLDAELRPTGESFALAGVPTALAASGYKLVVGTRAPGVLEVFDLNRWQSVGRYPIPADSVKGSQASTSAASVALMSDAAWVVTGGDDGDATIRRLDLATGMWEPLPYASEFGFDARGLRLRALGSSIWGVTTTTTPSSLYQLTLTNAHEFRGHDHTSLSCARDVLPLADGTVAVPGCETGLYILMPNRQTLIVARALETAIIPERGDWELEWIASPSNSATKLVASVTVERTDTTSRVQSPSRTRVTQFTADGTASTLIDVAGVALVSLAVDDRRLVAVVRDAAGRHSVIQATLK